jgi:glycosyltransferase involved in cell wall biosynthesis/CDP-glycerol glycerophosphotransferase (TagB/SpsB family)
MFAKKKFRKLRRDPKLFFADFVRKRVSVLPHKFKPTRTFEGKNKFTIVSAAYNVDNYLDDFFKSLTRQTLNFKKHIEIIIVDDGSTDKTPDIIKSWQTKYPDNIKYIKKENGGQASARNLGIKYISNPWVTFIDPDDFVDPNYFRSVDNTLKHRKTGVELVSCNFIFYFEDSKQFSDTHPLNYRFKKGTRTVNPYTENVSIQLSVNSAFFKSEKIQNENIVFGEKIKPSFEDAKFVIDYLEISNKSKITFVEEAKYYYRKRQDGSSTLDTSWKKFELFDNVLRFGCLPLLKSYNEKYGFVPEFVQRTVLYHLIWQIKVIVNNEESIDFLGAKRKAIYFEHLKEIFKYIDEETISKFNLAGCWTYHKVGMLSLFNKKPLTTHFVYPDEFDETKSLVKLRYFSHEIGNETFYLDGIDITPAYVKTIPHSFLDENFVKERIIWLPIEDSFQSLSVHIHNKPAKIFLSGKHLNNIKASEISDFFNQTSTHDRILPVNVRILRWAADFPSVKKAYQNSWLFMDRDIQADDNAEHLYRYIKNYQSSINSYFILRRSSHDWDRLKLEGFKLIPFGSLRHKFALMNSNHLISSHADKYIFNYLDQRHYNDKLRYKQTFLQHGTTHNDMSSWFNSKKFNCLITSSPYELQDISEGNGRYKFTPKETVFSGFPRHDTLSNSSEEAEKTLLIMPTWRNYVVGGAKGKTNSRFINNNFMSTEYAQSWQSLLLNETLRNLTNNYGYKIIFFPHANIQPYLNMFTFPDYIKVLNHNDIKIQKLFMKSTAMITDYSSVAFEMGFMNKQVLYYQFDADAFFNGEHSYKKGYFDYNEHGFGPVSYTENKLLEHLSQLLENNGKPLPEYLERMTQFFPLQDGNNCQRTFEAIKALEEPRNPEDINADILLKQAESASQSQCWELAAERWHKVLTLEGDSPQTNSLIQSAEALRSLENFDAAKDALLKAEKLSSNSATTWQFAELASAQKDWLTAQALWQQLSIDPSVQKEMARLKLITANRMLGNFEIAEKLIRTIDKSKICSLALANEKAELALAKQDWQSAEEIDRFLLDEHLEDVPKKVYLRLSSNLRIQGRYIESQDFLNTYLENNENDFNGRIEQAELASANENLKDAEELWQSVLDAESRFIPHHSALMLARTKRLLGNFEEAHKLLEAYDKQSSLSEQVRLEKANIAIAQENWQQAIECLQGTTLEQGLISVAFSLRQLGKFGEAKEVLHILFEKHPESNGVLLEYAQLATAVEDWELAIKYWSKIRVNHKSVEPTKVRLELTKALRNLGCFDEAQAILLGDAELIILEKFKSKPNSSELLIEYAGLMGMMQKNKITSKPSLSVKTA